MKKVIAQDVASALGIDKVEAAYLLKTMVALGKATVAGCRKSETGKGRPTPVYSIADTVELDFASVASVSGVITLASELPQEVEAVSAE